MKVAAVSFLVEKINSWKEFESRVRVHLDKALAEDVVTVVFPEYLTAPIVSYTRDWDVITDDYIELFKKLAAQYNINILAGTHLQSTIKGKQNVAYLFCRDGRIITQDKNHMTPSEKAPLGLTGGRELKVFELEGIKTTILICYDVEFPELVRCAVQSGAELLLVPSCTDDEHGYNRVRFCAQARCVENPIYVIQAPLVGKLPFAEFEISEGKAGIFCPSNIGFGKGGKIAIGNWNQDDCVVANLDFEKLRLLREAGQTTPLHDLKPSYKVENVPLLPH